MVTLATIIFWYETPVVWLLLALVPFFVALALWCSEVRWRRRLTVIPATLCLALVAWSGLLVWWQSQRGSGTYKDDRIRVEWLVQAVRSHYAMTGIYPTASEGWSVLMNPPPGIRPMLDRAPTDRFGRPIHYQLRDGRPCVIALGRDGELGTKDDVESRTCLPPEE